MKSYAVSVVLYRLLPTGQTEIKNELLAGVLANTPEEAREYAISSAQNRNEGLIVAIEPVIVELIESSRKVKK